MYYRTFARIRDEHEDLDLSQSFFIRLFYEDFIGDPLNVEAGFLKSQLLVMVRKHSILPVVVPSHTVLVISGCLHLAVVIKQDTGEKLF